MNSSGVKVQQFILQAAIPIACSILVGYLFFQDGVFSRHHNAFQFLWNGIVASLFYYLLVSVRTRDALGGFLVLFLLTFAITRSSSAVLILRDILYTAAIGGSIYLYFRYFHKAAGQNIAYPAVTLGGIYGILYVIAGQLQLAIVRNLRMEGTPWHAVGAASTSAFFGLLIGASVGAGIAIAGMIFDRDGGV
jgi:hypothetical protein